jgi:hypothetical protein
VRPAFLIPLLIASTLLPAQEKGALPLPDPGNVTLTLDEYNRLSELANRPVKKLEPPPLPYSLKHANLKLRVDNESVFGTVEFEGEVLKKGFAKVPLASGMTILEAHQQGKVLPLEEDRGTQTAVLAGPSEFVISLEAGLPLKIDAGRASLTLPVPSAGSATLTFLIPGEHTYANISPGLITNRTSENGHTTIEATLVPGQAANLWWGTRATATPAGAREVRFLADLKTLISVSEAGLSVAALADITVVQGDPSQFEVVLPADYEVTGVTGASLESSEVQSGTLVLKVSTPAQRNHQFLISMERSISSAKTDAPLLSVKNAQRETGEILVEGAGTMEITAVESGGLKRMDVKEANPYLRSLAHFPQAAFRYHRQPNETENLALEWVRFPDSSVLAAVAENAVVTTLVTSEGKSLTEVKLMIKNQAQPFLKIALPSGASILSADVAGEKVKPVEAPDGSRVPLLRPGFRPTDPYTISFVFLHSGSPFAKKGGSEISLPGMDIPIDLLQWEIFLPEQFKVKDFTGDAISSDLVPTAFQPNMGADQIQEAQLSINANNFKIESLLPGQLGGIVTDPSGAVVPNVRVTVTSDLGFNMTTLTNGAGFWQVSSVPSGSVKIQLDSRGFRTTVQNALYDANRPTLINLVLQVANTSETVEVTAVATGTYDNREAQRAAREAQKQAQAAQNAPSSNVINLQRRVAGVLPVAVDVPHAGTAFHFVRPLVMDEETKISFAYKSK